MKKNVLLVLMAFIVITQSFARYVSFKNYSRTRVDVQVSYLGKSEALKSCRDDNFSVDPGATVTVDGGACSVTQITATGAIPYTSPGSVYNDYGLIWWNDRWEVHHVDNSGTPLDLDGSVIPNVIIVNKTDKTITGQISYLRLGALCPPDNYTVNPHSTFTPSANRGGCLLTDITGTTADGKTVVAYKSTGTDYNKFGVIYNPRTDKFEVHHLDGNDNPVDIQPGFIIKNKTKFPVEVSLNQVGCLYHGVILPGEQMERTTGGVWFTLKYQINLDGEPKIDDMKDCVLPVAEIVGQIALAAFTEGFGSVTSLTSIAMTAPEEVFFKAVVAGAEWSAEVVAEKGFQFGTNFMLKEMYYGAIKEGLKITAENSLRIMFKDVHGTQNPREADATEFGKELGYKYSGELVGQYAGSPFGLSEKPTYEITGGPIIEYDKQKTIAYLNTVDNGATRLCITKTNTVGDDMMRGSKTSTQCDPASATRTPPKVVYYPEIEVTNYTQHPREVLVSYQDRDNHQTRHAQDKFTVAPGAKGSPNNIREDFLIEDMLLDAFRYKPGVGAKPADYKFGIIDVGDENETYEMYPLDDAGKPLNLSASTKATYVDVGNYHNVVFYNNTNAAVTVTVNYTDGTKDQFTVASATYGMAAGIRGRRLITSVAATGAGVKDYSAVNCASFVGTNYRFGLGDKKQVSRSKPGGTLLNEPAPPNDVDYLLLSTTGNNDIYYPNKAVIKNSVPVGVYWSTTSIDQMLLVSSNGKYSLVLKNYSANIILLKELTTTVWENKINAGGNGRVFKFYYDGNLVVREPGYMDIWSANCGGLGGKTLKLEDDGRLVIYDAANKAIWSKGIDGKTTLTPATNTPTTGGATATTAATTPAATTTAATNTPTTVVATATPATNTPTPQFGNALNFNGLNNYAMTPNLYNKFPGTDATIELWFKADAAGVILQEDGQNAINTGWRDSQIELLSTGEVKVRVWPLAAVLVGKVSFGTWNHVVVRYNAVTKTLDGLLNGVASATTTKGDRQRSSEQYYAIGATDATNLGSGAYFKGTIDEVRIWNVARTNAQIISAMNTESVGNEAGLVAYYNFNQGVANGKNSGINNLTDKTSNGLKATLFNFLLSGNSSNFTTGAAQNSAAAGSIWTYSQNNQTLLTSPNGKFTLVYQGDGNLVLYKNITTSIWSSKTNGKSSATFKFQTDGNLVIYGAGNSVVWSPNCYGKAGQTLTLQDDGNLVVYTGANQPIWATGTNGM